MVTRISEPSTVAPENGWWEDGLVSFWVSACFQVQAVSFFREAGPPKWMFSFNGNPLIKMNDLGGGYIPLFLETPK